MESEDHLSFVLQFHMTSLQPRSRDNVTHQLIKTFSSYFSILIRLGKLKKEENHKKFRTLVPVISLNKKRYLPSQNKEKENTTAPPPKDQIYWAQTCGEFHIKEDIIRSRNNKKKRRKEKKGENIKKTKKAWSEERIKRTTVLHHPTHQPDPRRRLGTKNRNPRKNEIDGR